MKRFPLSLAQQGLWFLSGVDDYMSAAYNTAVAFTSETPLELPRMRIALQAALRRHPMPGARIEMQDWQPMFVVDALAPQPNLVAVTDRLETVAEREIRRPFDFAAGPLHRFVLVDDPHTRRCGLLMVFPHLVFDGGSLEPWMDTLTHAYASPQKYDHANSPETDPFQCAAQEMSWLSSIEGRKRLRSAAARLGRMANTVPLLRRHGPRADVFEAAQRHLLLPPAMVAAVGELALSERVSSASIYLAAFQWLLGRLSGARELSIGVPVQSRSAAATAGLVGHFTNLGVAGSSLMLAQTRRELLRAASDSLLDILEDNDLPFPAVLREIGGGGDLQGSFMRVTYNHAQRQRLRWQVGIVDWLLVNAPEPFTKSEFKLDVEEGPGGVRCAFTIDRDGFDLSMLDAAESDYLRLLEALTGTPEATLAALPLVSTQERAALEESWRQPEISSESRCPVHEQFEAQAARAPMAPAVSCHGETWTYGRLNEEANRVAHTLRELGVAPEVLVAVCLERSPVLVAVLLGVLKAGGAYVPLDPQYPQARLRYMLHDSGAAVVVTQAALRAELSPGTAQVLEIDGSDAGRLAAACTLNPARLAGPDNLAYCIYTSGSTGRPKGSLNMHKGLSGLAAWYFSEAVAPAAHERVLLASSLSFDLTHKNILATLANGAELILPHGEATDAETICAAAHRYRPTRINCAPSAFRAFGLLDESVVIGTVVLGGEPIEPRLAARVRQQGSTLVNSYGPTECSDVVASYRAPPEPRADRDALPIPIGRPIPGARLYILDEQLEPVPAGIVGEIYIAGTAVGRGYLNRPGLTAGQFLPDPHGRPGSRMYRSGDLGCRRSDGCIDFLGRRDQQAKIRGIRIELGEIESVLAACPGVREVAVVERRDLSDAACLAAYIVASDAMACPDPGLLAEALLQKLPPYMIPSAWCFLDVLPLNPNGKLDRAALPPATPARSLPHDASAPAAPSSAVEQEMLRIWADVLGHEDVFAGDNFFVLGGHSLLATQLVGRINARWSVKTSVRTLFESPTVSSMSLRVEAMVASSAVGVPSIPRRTRNADVKKITH